MQNLVAFINCFLSYLLVMVVIVIVAGVAFFIGVTLRKNKNAKEELLNAESSETEN